MKAITLLALLLIELPIIAQASLSSEIDNLIQTRYQNGRFSGALLVADQGEIIINKTYGFRDVEGEQPLNQVSVFEIASLTKSFTSMLVGIIKEQGQLQLDDAVTKHLPQFPYPEVTIRHLLSHTAGLSERKFFQWAGGNMKHGTIYHNNFILNYLETEKPELAFTPGTQWEYSNVGYMVLAALLEKLTDKHFIELLKEQILSPLNMQQSGIYSQEHKEKNMSNYAFSQLFNPKDSVWMPAFGMTWSDSIYGSVGLISNTTDLLKWDEALYSGQLLSEETKSEMFDATTLSNGKSSGYGLGWFVEEDHQINGRSVGKKVSHYGLWPGYESSIVRFIDQRKTIIIISNQAPSAKDEIVKKIAEMLFR